MSNRRQPRNIARVNGSPPALVRPHFPGVDTRDWTDLPPAQYPPATVDYIAGELALGAERRTVNGYVCDGCQGITVTRDAHPGVTPSLVDHVRFDPNTRCPGTGRSLFYPDEDLPDGWAPSHEWYRPGEVELTGLDDRHIDHVLRGGLLLRLLPLDETQEAGR